MTLAEQATDGWNLDVAERLSRRQMVDLMTFIHDSSDHPENQRPLVSLQRGVQKLNFRYPLVDNIFTCRYNLLSVQERLVMKWNGFSTQLVREELGKIYDEKLENRIHRFRDCAVN